MSRTITKTTMVQKKIISRTEILMRLNSKFRKSKMRSTKSELVMTWKKYCENTKLAGLHYIGGHRDMSMNRKMILIIIWISGFSLSVYKCSYCLQIYLDRDIQTTIIYDSMPELQFPAITVCHVIGMRKSVLGMSKDMTKLVSYMMIREPGELKMLQSQNWRTCQIENVTKEDGDKIKFFLYSLALNEDFETFFKATAVDSTMSVKNCWWNNREMNCSNFFLNHQIQNNMCFTFNQDPKYIDYNKAAIGVAVYGAKNYTEKTSESYGPFSGLKVLLDVHQEESCMSLMERFGSGFRIFVHDSRSQSNFNVDSSISLSPGYDYTIALKPKTYDRRNFSDSLGHCTSFVYNFLKPNETEYSQESCFASCFTESVFQKCNCLAVEQTSEILSQSTANYLGLAKNSLKVCTMLNITDRICFTDQTVLFLSQNTEVFCPKCKRSCLETEYDYQLTGKKLSRAQIASITYTYQTNKSIEKNFMMVSFMFDDKNLVTIREIQAFTSLNLYIAIGGILGLFLGFSTVSLYEIVHYFLISCSILIRRTLRRKPNTNIRRKSNINQRAKAKINLRRTKINPAVVFTSHQIRY